ncbi:MAG TPA: hypothetical protein VJR22_02620 [Candidatus Nitrosotalea sp.]|nr:hypothetical protein [Candidatus Nitrosotalea sp.]
MKIENAIIVILIVGAGIMITYFVILNWWSNTHATTTVTQISHYDSTNSTSDTSLDLVLVTNSSIIQQGHAIGIDVLLNNTSAGQLTMKSQKDWPVKGLTWRPCTGMPFGIELFNGYYSQENVTQGKPLTIIPDRVIHCNVYRDDNRQGTTYVFQPLSDTAFLESTSGNFSDEIHDNFWLPSFNDDIIFEPGTYTIVAGDEWGHLVIQHFAVTNTTQN